jgi:phenylacetate-coenzyme A ligase PaaK-like adenylate-forming protein
MGFSTRRNPNFPGKMRAGLRERIFSVKAGQEFETLALEIFRYQAESNAIYKEFIKGLGRDPGTVNKITDIPFLPIEFFRNHRVLTGSDSPECVFESSGTTGIATSRHFVTDTGIYDESFLRCFKMFYGEPEEYFIAALLPSYLERANSSLVYMAGKLIKTSAHNGSSFFLNDHKELIKKLALVQKEGRKSMLIGVSFALLDLAETYSPDLSRVIVAETGGMKGRRKELTRVELHSILKNKFNINSVHSEYGMTELLSQAWSKGEGIYSCPPWMRILLREINDPLSVFTDTGITGGINIIDLANINSCSFIATGDLGKIVPDGGFEVHGRFDNSDIRGCNLLVQ